MYGSMDLTAMIHSLKINIYFFCLNFIVEIEEGIIPFYILSFSKLCSANRLKVCTSI